jgi:SulP family sulfate permease
MVTTFLLTVLVDLTVAIQVGVVLAAFLFMKRMADVTQTSYLRDEIDETDFEDEERVSERKIPDGVAVFEIYGPFFFGAADKFKSTLNRVHKKPKVIVLRMRHVPAVDATGLHALQDVFDKAKRDGTTLILAGVNAQPLEVLEQSGFARQIGSENMAPNLDAALERSRALLAAR